MKSVRLFFSLRIEFQGIVLLGTKRQLLSGLEDDLSKKQTEFDELTQKIFEVRKHSGFDYEHLNSFIRLLKSAVPVPQNRLSHTQWLAL